MTATVSPAALVPAGPVFSEPEQLALGGFLASYTGLTREAYMLDLRQFAVWCQQRHIALFAARRVDIERFARDLEAKGRARSTVSRRLATIAGFYRYAVEEDLLAHSPAAHVRRPRLDYESHATGLDRNEIGAILVAAGLGSPAEHALISLLALNGLRVSEAVGADIEALSLQRGHRTLAIIRKGGKKAIVPLAPRTARAIDLAIGERCQGPIFLTTAGNRLDRHGAGRIVRRVAKRAGLTKPVGPHTLRHASPPPSTPASRSAMSRKPHPTLIRAPPCATTAHGPPWTGTPPTSSPPISPEPPANHEHGPYRPPGPASARQAGPGQAYHHRTSPPEAREGSIWRIARRTLEVTLGY